MKKCLILSILALISGCSDISKVSTPIDKPVTKKVQAQKTKEKETLYKRMLPGGSWAWMKQPPPPDSNEPVITYEMVQAQDMAQAQKYKEDEDKLNEILKSWMQSTETYGQSYSAAMQSWVGHDMSELIARWGSPSREMSDGRGGRILIYESPRTFTSPGYSTTNVYGSASTYGSQTYGSATGTTTYYPPTTSVYTASRCFWVDSNGKIYNWSWKDWE